MIFAAPEPPADYYGWNLGLIIGLLVVVVVVALVTPILVLAWRIGKQAPQIDAALQQSYHNTKALEGLNTTISHAVTIIGGLKRARSALGGGDD
jgi:hypothetical protein